MYGREEQIRVEKGNGLKGKEDDCPNQTNTSDQQRSRDRITTHGKDEVSQFSTSHPVVQHLSMPRPSETAPSIPAGYVLLTGPDEQRYLVPRFMVPATEHALEAEQQKRQLEVKTADKGVSPILFAPTPY